ASGPRRLTPGSSRYGLAVEVGGEADAPDLPHGGGEVHDVRVRLRELAVAEEHAAADLGGGGAVVAAPLAVVVLDHRALDLAQGVLPAHAVAVVEAHLQVGRVGQELALVDVVPVV